jgi:hypothetical protein
MPKINTVKMKGFLQQNLPCRSFFTGAVALMLQKRRPKAAVHKFSNNFGWLSASVAYDWRLPARQRLMQLGFIHA